MHTHFLNVSQGIYIQNYKANVDQAFKLRAPES